MQPKKEREYLVAICVSLTTFTLYVKTLHPSLPGGDSGELVVAAHELGVSHPPGYPLFTLLSVLALHLVPVGSPVWRVNLLSAFLGASTSGVVYLLIYRLTKSLGAGCLGVAMFSLSRLVWVWSCVAEVFSLNNLMLALLMLTAVHFDTLEERTMKQMAYIGAFLCGLCLSNQHTSVLYIVFLVPWVMFRLWNAKLLSFALLVKLTLLFMLGLSPYLYLPVSSAVNKARWTWGDQSSLNGFLRHLLRQEYGTWDLLKDHRGQGFVSGILSYSSHVARDLSVPVSVLAVLSLWSTSYRYKVSKSSVLAVFTGMLIAYITFFCWRANLDIGNPLFFKVVERFWIQSDLVLSVLAAVSFDDFCRFISHRFRALSWYHLDILLMMPLFAWQL
ncbi:transmembrane protein 260, partial [Plakobranchus ocellatus]